MSQFENLLKAKLVQNFFVKGPSVKEVVEFVKRPENSIQYVKAIKVLERVTSDCDLAAKNTGLLKARILATLSDGTVWFDSSKTNNTHEAFKLKKINENHNTRLAILKALKHGEGFEAKYSTSNNNRQEYIAIRLGASSELSLGVIRLSFIRNK